MEKRSLKEWLIRSFILMIGLTIAHFGVTLFLLSDLGADPFNVLIQGIYRKLVNLTGSSLLTHGRTHMLISLLIIAFLLLIDKIYIKAGTVLCMICGGPIIDAFTWLLHFILPDNMHLIYRLFMLIFGCIILAYGMTIVIQSDAGTGPNDLVALVLSDKIHKKFGIIRLIVDAVFTLLGFALGGVVGAGTIVCIALVGPVAGFFLPVNGRLVNRCVRKSCS
ncbi:MAG: hypothetical protein K6G09_08190 [Treponema sp.]|nr:hypothetical protein [Treponema sp.]